MRYLSVFLNGRYHEFNHTTNQTDLPDHPKRTPDTAKCRLEGSYQYVGHISDQHADCILHQQVFGQKIQGRENKNDTVFYGHFGTCGNRLAVRVRMHGDGNQRHRLYSGFAVLLLQRYQNAGMRRLPASDDYDSGMYRDRADGIAGDAFVVTCYFRHNAADMSDEGHRKRSRSEVGDCLYILSRI